MNSWTVSFESGSSVDKVNFSSNVPLVFASKSTVTCNSSFEVNTLGHSTSVIVKLVNSLLSSVMVKSLLPSFLKVIFLSFLEPI